MLERIDRDLDASLERLFALLRIQSISTDPAFKDPAAPPPNMSPPISRASALTPRCGRPAVIRSWSANPATAKPNGKAPRVLFYGHYDVQPVDPLDEWTHPPFEPRIETLPDGRKIIVARGACDDKGQAMTFVEACRAYKAVTGSLPLPITMMIEGEEECGSKNLFGFVRDHADEFKLDLALICDTSMWDQKTPAITTSLRGLVYEEVRLTCADRDLHSGLFGGAAQNPMRVLSKILAAMHDDKGRVTIPGFYDGVDGTAGRRSRPTSSGAQSHGREIPRPGRAEGAGRREGPHADRADRDPADRRDQRHHRRLHRRGRQDRHPRQGLGQGLVPPGGTSRTRRRSARRSAPSSRRGCRSIARSNSPISPTRRPSSCRSTTRRSTRRARALAAEWGKKAVTIGAGGSIPIVGDFKSVLGMDSLMVGFALDDDRVHSPNEKFDLTSFHKGIRSWARILDALSA